LFSVICSDGSGYSRKRNLDQERQGRKNGQWYSASSMQLHDKWPVKISANAAM
jgi:hypothetical protein